MRSSGGFELLKQIASSLSCDSLSPVKMDSSDRKALGSAKQLLEEGESILLARKLIKINRWEQKQLRTTIITNLRLYTLREGEMRRRVPLDQIEAISVSLTSNEFVLHIPSDYDCRFDTESKVSIINLIARTRNASYMYAKQLLIYPHEDPLLDKITVTQDIMRNKSYRKLYVCGSTPICCKLDDLSLEINRRVNSHRHCEGDILYIDHDFADQFFHAKMQSLMNLYKAEAYTCTLMRCIKSRKLYTRKRFMKKTLRVTVDFFRNCLINHQNNRFKEHLHCATELEEYFELVFKFYPCGDLYGQRNYKETQYPENVLKHIMVRCILGINRLEQQDYKPFILENILVDRHGNTFIADYLHYTQEEGSRQYLSPEEVVQSISNTGQYDSKMCNIWRLGIFMYELAYGVTPFSLANLLWSIQKNLELQVKFLKRKIDYSEDFEQAISKLLSKNPKDRPGFNGMKDYLQLKFLKNVDWQSYSSTEIFPPVKYHHTDIEFEAYQFGGAKLLFE